MTINIEDIKDGDTVTIYRRPTLVGGDPGEHTGIAFPSSGYLATSAGCHYILPHELNHIVAHRPAPQPAPKPHLDVEDLEAKLAEKGDQLARRERQLEDQEGVVTRLAGQITGWQQEIGAALDNPPGAYVLDRDDAVAKIKELKARALAAKSLKQMACEVRAVNRSKGWRDSIYPGQSDRAFGEDVALLHSEVSEILEAYREHGVDDATEVRVASGDPRPLPKPEGVGSEMADVLIRLLDFSYEYGIDLQAEYERKLAYNRTRPYRHGNKRL